MSHKLLTPGLLTTLVQPTVAISFANALAGAPLIASWRGEPTPVEVALTQQVVSFSPGALPIYAGQPAGGFQSEIAPQYPGFFVLDYGCGALVRRRIVDLVSARLFLGTCTNVQIRAARWLGGSWPAATAFDVQVAGSIAESAGGESDEMTHTVQVFTAAAGTPTEVIVPPEGATSCAASVGLLSIFGSLQYWGSAEPDYLFQGGAGFGYEGFTFLPSKYSVVPSWRRTAAPGVLTLTTSAPVIGNTVATVRWYLNS